MKWIISRLNTTCQRKELWTDPACAITTPDVKNPEVQTTTSKHATPTPKTTPTYKNVLVTRNANGAGNFGLPSTTIVKRNTKPVTKLQTKKYRPTPSLPVRHG